MLLRVSITCRDACYRTVLVLCKLINRHSLYRPIYCRYLVRKKRNTVSRPCYLSARYSPRCSRDERCADSSRKSCSEFELSKVRVSADARRVHRLLPHATGSENRQMTCACRNGASRRSEIQRRASSESRVISLVNGVALIHRDEVRLGGRSL